MNSKFGVEGGASSIANPSRYMTVTYVLSLTLIGILSVVVHVMLDRVIVEQSQTGMIVNISGQQRMLSQRVSLFSLDYLATGSSQSKVLAESALKKLNKNHSLLTAPHFNALSNNEESPLSEPLKVMYFSEPMNVHQSLMEFESAVRKVLYSIDDDINLALKAESFLSMSRHTLLDALDAVVRQYELESVERVNELRVAQNMVLGIIILTILIEAVFVFRPMVAKVSDFARRIQHDANHDHLTGLYNRRAFYLMSEQVASLAQRNKRPLCVLMIDIDHFKKINDRFGHDAGDIAIKRVSGVLESCSRQSDIVSRFGGEEFIILLPETDLQGARTVGEKIRAEVIDSSFEFDGQLISMTVSCGAAECLPDVIHLDTLVAQADKALYEAKQTGRNKTCLFAGQA